MEMTCEVASHQNTVDPLLSREHPRMYLSVADLHALTVSLTLVDLHQCLHRIIKVSFPLYSAAVYLYRLSSVHPSIHSFISLCPSPRVVSSVLWRSRLTVFSLCFFTPLFNKVLNQGHHLRLLCASMTSPPVNP